jgi:hypothetical protein
MNRSLILLIAVLTGTAVYLISAHAPFIYDDVDQILHNAKLHSLTPLTDVIFSGLRQIRVISNLSYAWDWVIGKGATWPFHITNIVFHLINTALVWCLLGRILSREGSEKAVERAFLQDFTSFLFLIHPIQAEAVSYISGRTSLLQAFGFLAALLAFSSPKRKPLLISFILIFSLLLKESCALIPFVLLGYELTLNKKTWNTVSKKEFALYFGSTLLILPFYMILKDPHSMYDGTIGFSLYPIASYYIWQARYYLFYLWVFVNPAAQSIIHVPPDVSVNVVIQGLLGIFLCLTAVVFVYRKKFEFPIASFLVILFFFPLLPTNSFIQMINPFAEYRLYLSNLSLFFLLSWLVLKLVQFISEDFFKKLVVFVSATIICVFSSLQQITWSNEVEISQRSVDNYPNSYKTHLLLGGAYEDRGDLEAARGQYADAVNLVQTDEQVKTYRPWILLARIYLKQGKYKECTDLLETIQIDALQETKAPLAYYQIYLFALAQLKDRKKFDQLKEKALKNYSDASLPTLQ